MPTKKKSPKRPHPKVIREMLVTTAQLTTRMTMLESSVRTDMLTIGRLMTRLDKLEARDCAKATMEALVYAPDYVRVTDIHGRLIYWANRCAHSLRIVDMDDGHLKNAIAYLRRGAGSLTDPQRAEFLETLAYEHGRRNALKGL